MSNTLVKSAKFVISNSDVRKCPQDGKPEYAFIGRSNVGKSSLINMLTRQRKLAMTSSTPGKTLLINHFLINDEWYLVDLPGYGYAKANEEVKETKRYIEEDLLPTSQVDEYIKNAVYYDEIVENIDLDVAVDNIYNKIMNF